MICPKTYIISKRFEVNHLKINDVKIKTRAIHVKINHYITSEKNMNHV